MTELLETIAIAMPSDDKWECPFDHQKKKFKEKDNVMEEWEKNDADVLGTNLTDEYHFQERLQITVNGEAHEAQYTPHHLIPGKASWPKSKLQKWVDKRHKAKMIKANYGYDVNGQDNGVSLPGIHGLKAITGKKWSSFNKKPNFQRDYAFAAIEASRATRQFHDSHPAYNEFVTKVLNKVAEKLDKEDEAADYPGCKKKHCTGGKGKVKKFDPPIYLLARLEGIALRLEGYLTGNSSKWRMPIFTSRFAYMYQMHCNQTSARKAMSDARKKVKADDF